MIFDQVQINKILETPEIENLEPKLGFSLFDFFSSNFRTFLSSLNFLFFLSFS